MISFRSAVPLVFFLIPIEALAYGPYKIGDNICAVFDAGSNSYYFCGIVQSIDRPENSPDGYRLLRPDGSLSLWVGNGGGYSGISIFGSENEAKGKVSQLKGEHLSTGEVIGVGVGVGLGIIAAKILYDAVTDPQPTQVHSDPSPPLPPRECRGDFDGDGALERAVLVMGPLPEQYRIRVQDSDREYSVDSGELAAGEDYSRFGLWCNGSRISFGLEGTEIGVSYFWTGTKYAMEEWETVE